MVIEHSFVTILAANEAMERASAFLLARGFVNAEQSGFQLGITEWTTLEMRRGKKKATRTMTIIELPQTLRIEFDRGRISLAASLPALGKSFWSGRGKEMVPTSKKARPHVDYLTTIAMAIEHLLVNQHPPEQAGAAWTAADASLTEVARRRRRNSRIVLFVALTFVLAMIALVVYAAIR